MPRPNAQATLKALTRRIFRGALMSDRIRTFTEQIADDSLQTTIHDRISNAETLLFLGFSFHEQNMQLIRPSSECQAKQVLGTAFGISESNV
jgi:hypothetical protein